MYICKYSLLWFENLNKNIWLIQSIFFFIEMIYPWIILEREVAQRNQEELSISQVAEFLIFNLMVMSLIPQLIFFNFIL